MTPEQLAGQIIVRSIIRFGKVFIATGASAAALVPSLMGVSYHDVRSYVTATILAFVAGGVLGVEKLITQLYGVSSTESTQTK